MLKNISKAKQIICTLAVMVITTLLSKASIYAATTYIPSNSFQALSGYTISERYSVTPPLVNFSTNDANGLGKLTQSDVDDENNSTDQPDDDNLRTKTIRERKKGTDTTRPVGAVPKSYSYNNASIPYDETWMNKTIAIKDVYSGTVQLYLAQGNIAAGSTMNTAQKLPTGQTLATFSKTNKLWLAWERVGYAKSYGAMPSGSWYNSNFTKLYKFNNYNKTRESQTDEWNEAAGYTKGVQFFRADSSEIPSYFRILNTPLNIRSLFTTESTLNSYYFNLRMPCSTLHPYLKILNLDRIRTGYTFKNMDLYNYTNTSYYAYNESGAISSATPSLNSLTYIDEDKDSLVVDCSSASNLGGINVNWARHVYTFQFNCPDADDPTTQYLDMKYMGGLGSSVSVAPIPTRTGYLFTGWKDDGNITVFSKEGKASNSHTYWRDASTGILDHSAKIFIKAPADAKDANAPKLDKISGINTNSNLANDTEDLVYTYDNSTGNRTGVISLKATWKPITYNVQYEYNNQQDDVNDSQPSNPTEWEYDVSQTIKAPTRRGYTFAGWTVKNGDVTSLPAGDVLTSNLTSVNGRTVTLVANWTANTYKITFHSNFPNGAAEKVYTWEIEYDTNEKATSYAPTFTCKNYHMADYKTTDGTSYYTWTQNNPAGEFYQNHMARNANNKWWDSNQNNAYKIWYDIDVYASWDKNPYTIVYDSNDGTAVEDQLAYSGDDTILKAGPTREGYTFLGWSVYNEDKDYYDNAVDQSGRAAIYKNSEETDPLKDPVSRGNNSRNYFRTADADSPGSITFNIEKDTESIEVDITPPKIDLMIYIN